MPSCTKSTSDENASLLADNGLSHERFFLDTNIVSYILRGDGQISSVFAYKLLNREHLAVSAITHYEILGGLYHVNALRKLDQYYTLITPLEIIPFGN